MTASPADLIRGYQRSLRRLEQQPVYLTDVRAGALDVWLAGGPAAPPLGTWPDRDDWLAMVRTKGAQGATVERVRVYLDPPTAYQTWNREASVLQVEAGEVQHYVTRAEADAVGLNQAGDWWLIDGELLIEYQFDGIEPVGVDVVDNPGRIAAAERWWQVASDLVQVAVV